MSTTSANPEDRAVNFLSCIGLGYAAGAVGGSSYHFSKAFQNSPNGQRFISGIRSVRMNAPQAATSFAFWAGGVFTASEWKMRCLRQEDDLWNSTVAGTVTGMLYNLRRGLVPASKFGLCCGAAVCMIEGISILVQPTPGQTKSLFSALLGGPNIHDKTSSMAKAPESFDLPSPATSKYN